MIAFGTPMRPKTGVLYHVKTDFPENPFLEYMTVVENNVKFLRNFANLVLEKEVNNGIDIDLSVIGVQMSVIDLRNVRF